MYNTELYIEKCLESVIKQTYQDWELIIINDGSTDESFSRCNSYRKRDNRVILIDKLNEGVSQTRNLGLSIASGKYVIFLDSDDYWIDEDFLERFVNYAEKNELDIVRGEYKSVNSEDIALPINGINLRKRMLEKKILDSVTFLDEVVQREFFLPLCLIKRDVLKDVLFNGSRVFLEDVEFFLKVLQKPLRCYYMSDCFYAYRKHSLSASNNYNQKRLADAFDISRLYLELSLNTSDERLALSFRIRGWDYYWLTLRTIATEKTLFVNRKSLSEDLSLRKLRNQMADIMSDINPENKWLVKLSPCMAICYFRLRYIIGKLLK